MDNEENIKLFSVDENDIALPSIDSTVTETESKLISESIDGAILGEKIKTLILKEDTEIAPYNYIFDFTTLESINVMQKQSLKSLVSKYGDVQLYLYNKKNGLIAFGMGDKYSLERLVPLIRLHVFNNEIKVYKDFKVGEPVQEVNSKDITKMRLNL
jgi:hypothetical protein